MYGGSQTLRFVTVHLLRELIVVALELVDTANPDSRGNVEAGGSVLEKFPLHHSSKISIFSKAFICAFDSPIDPFLPSLM